MGHYPSTSTMHLILLSIFLAVTMAEPDNCKNKDSCDIQEYIQQIDCAKDQNCKCTKGGTKEECENFEEVTYKDMTKEKCKERCTNLTGSDCVFYRWDQAGFTNGRTCTLMSVDQCAKKGRACVPYS